MCDAKSVALTIFMMASADDNPPPEFPVSMPGVASTSLTSAHFNKRERTSGEELAGTDSRRGPETFCASFEGKRMECDNE